jgi:transcriptional regulator with XRE-family HTH domain
MRFANSPDMMRLTTSSGTLQSDYADHNLPRPYVAADEQIVPMQLFAKRIRDRARELDLTDAEVARRAGLSERRYGYYVTGEREPNLATLVRICEVLAVTPNDVLLSDGRSPVQSQRGRSIGKIGAVVSNLSMADLELAVCQLECLLTLRRKEHQRRARGRRA